MSPDRNHIFAAFGISVIVFGSSVTTASFCSIHGLRIFLTSSNPWSVDFDHGPTHQKFPPSLLPARAVSQAA
jgi:hypothetical protein